MGVDHVLAAFFMLLVLAASSQESALAGSQPSALLPKQLKMHWRSLDSNEPISSISLEWDGRVLNYKVTRPSSVNKLDSDIRSISPTTAAWTEFWRDLDEHQVWKWAQVYGANLVSSEGRAWDLSVRTATRTVKSSGTGVYPSVADVSKPSQSPAMLNRLWYSVDKLVGSVIDVQGTYLCGFETSRFTPSTEKYKGQRWWVSTSADFNKRYERLTPKTERTFPFVGPEVFTRLRGRLVGPGHYGHLNQYPYEFFVEEVVEMKRAKSSSADGQ